VSVAAFASFGSDCAICSHCAVLGADFGILLPVTNSGLETAFLSLFFSVIIFIFLVVISLSGKREIWICVFEALEWQF
jgi:hypothetical protein